MLTNKQTNQTNHTSSSLAEVTTHMKALTHISTCLDFTPCGFNCFSPTQNTFTVGTVVV